MGFKESLWGALGVKAAPVPPEVILQIRDAMLASLGEHGQDNYYALDMKITFSTDLEELWFLRPELQTALAAKHGEAAAAKRMQEITALFKGHRTPAKTSWFGSLGD